MKTEIVKICAALTGLIFLAAMQDMSPVVFGAKPPLLLVFGCIAGVPASIAAGMFADALGGLPFGCSAIFFLAATLLARFLKPFACFVVISSAVLYQAWMIMWGGNISMESSYVTVAYATLIFPVMKIAVEALKRRIGIDIADKEAAR